MFEVTGQLVGMDVQDGVSDDHVVLISVLGLQIPVGQNQAMAIPALVLRTPISRDAAIEYGQKLVEAASNLPDPTTKPDIVVASSLEGVDKAVKADQKFRGQ